VQGGAAGASPASTTGSADVQLPFEGYWALFTFEDPLVFSVGVSDEELVGYGCCVPPDDFGPDYCCGVPVGEFDGNHVAFTLTVSDFSFTYVLNLFASEDGTRLGGQIGGEVVGIDETKNDGQKIAALPFTDDGQRLPSNPALTGEELPQSSYFRLRAGESEGDGYLATETYRLGYLDGAVYGDFGSFWSTEVSVRENDAALLAGPVPVTDPRLPVSIVVRREGSQALDATVTMSSGASYLFDSVAAE